MLVICKLSSEYAAYIEVGSYNSSPEIQRTKDTNMQGIFENFNVSMEFCN